MYLVPLSSLPSLQNISQQDARQDVGMQPDNSSFSDIMQNAIETLRESQQAAEEDSYQLATGDVSSLHSMMINSTVQATAVETVVQLTSRAVSAYKEIMQMQI